MQSSLYPNAKIIEAMKINKLPAGKEDMLSSICLDGNYFGQIKKDGYFYQFEKTTDNSYLFSRNVSKDTGVLTEKGANVPHIMQALDCMPPETIIIGEIYYPGGTSKTVTPVMGSLPAKAIERQKGKPIHFYIHDIIYYDGYDLIAQGAETRYHILEKIYEKYNLSQYPFLELAIAEYDNLEEKINQALELGEEGFVLKKKIGPYTPGKRPAWTTIKVKKNDSLDVVLTKFLDPTKEYAGIGLLESTENRGELELGTWDYWEINGKLYNETINLSAKKRDVIPVTKPYFKDWKNAIEISAYDNKGNLIPVGTIASGLTDELRAEFAHNPSKYLGRTVEIHCMSLDKKEHTIRHGFFKGFRDDKDPKDCLLEEIFR